MKEFLTNISLATIFILLVYSCTKSGIENNAMNGNKIELSATQVEVNFEGKTECKVTVNSPCSWEAESKNDWLNVVTKQGIAGTKELFFYADDNYDLKKREGTIVVTNRDYGYIDELYVTQKGFEPRIEYTESITFNSEGGTKYATISANFSYSYSENASWITCSRTNDGLKVVATESVSTKERSAEITLYNDNYNVEKTIKILQKPFEPTLSVDKTELNFDVNGGSKTVYVTTNAEFNFSESSSWISCSKSSNRVTITVSASDVTEERSAEVEIYLTNYNLTQTIKVSQKKFVPEFEVKATELDFEAEGGTKTISVSANFDYSVSESASWLSYEKTSSGVKIIADANVDEQERTADVKIYNNTYGKSATVKVTQMKFIPELTIAKTELSFESVGGTQEIAISSNFDYQITSNVDWLTCKKVSNGVSVTASFYDIIEDRTTEITISNAKYNQSKSIKVTQKKFVLEYEVGISELTFEAEGGTQTIPITANFEYSVSESADWLSYQITSSGVKLTATANVEEQENTTEIRIYNDKYGVSKIVKVTQKKFVPYISVNKEIVGFEVDGGVQELQISSNITYDIQISDDWLSYRYSNLGIDIIVTKSDVVHKREAMVSILNAKYGVTKVVTITQEPFSPYINLSATNIQVATGGEETKIIIESNVEWDVNYSAEWIKHSSYSHGNYDELNISVEANTMLYSRSTQVSISNVKYNICKYIDIEQMRVEPFVNSKIETVSVEYTGGVSEVEIFANCDWQVVNNNSWIKYSVSNNMITISADINITDYTRSGYILAYNQEHDVSCRINVQQSFISANRKILYTSSNSSVITPYYTNGFGSAKIINNIYYNGQGVIFFDSPIINIANSAFKNSSKLQSVVIPDSVQTIGYEAFCNCSKLTSVYCKPTTPPSIGTYVFAETNEMLTIYVPKQSINTYKQTYGWLEYVDCIIGYNF